MKNIFRKKKFIVTLIILFFIWMYIGNTTFEISRYTYSNKKIPKAFDGFKIVHISDLHNKNWNEKLEREISKEKPDIIVITGDLIDSRRTNTEISLNFIKNISEIAPIYYVNGNHEARLSHVYENFERELLNAGVNVLDNSYSTIKKDDAEIMIAGLSDPNFTKKTDRLDSNSKICDMYLKNMPPSEDFKILLSHRPELIDVYEKNKMDLIFAGHAHGGQARIPLIGPIYAPGQGFFPKYAEGMKQLYETKIVISRGLGNSLFPVRFNNTFELVIVELENE